MAEKRQSYDAEFREGAVRIVTETGKTITQVAADLGIRRPPWAAGWRGPGGPAGTGRWASWNARSSCGCAGRAWRTARIKEVEMERDVFKRAMALWVK